MQAIYNKNQNYKNSFFWGGHDIKLREIYRWPFFTASKSFQFTESSAGKRSHVGNSSRPVVFIQHGLLGSSAVFVMGRPENAFGETSCFFND